LNKKRKIGDVDRLMNFISRKNLMLTIRNLSYLPRWLVVGMDLAVLIVSFFFTKLIINGVGLPYIALDDKIAYTCLLLGVNVFSFWVFRTYAGIIRHSSYTDAIKLLFSQISVLVFFVALNFIV